MIGVDTNILVRAFLGADPKLSPLARRAIENARDILVSITVLIELAWVLKSVGWNRQQIHQALATLAQQPTVHLQTGEPKKTPGRKADAATTPRRS